METRTRLVNHIHGVLKSFGLRVKEYAASSFHRHVEDEIPIELKSALRPLVKTLEGISECASGYDREIARLSTDVYPETALLNQVDRVGPITSLRCVLTIEDPGRIKKSRNVGAYLGLRPKQTTVWQARPGAANHEGR